VIIVKGKHCIVADLAMKTNFMNTLLWIAQALLAVAFLYSGINKAFLPKEEVIAKGQTGIVDIPRPGVRWIGASEILGSIGIIIPWALNILPILTPITAVCFAAIMTMAVPIHHRLNEPRNVITNLFLLALALFVSWFRFRQSF
jgi:uncharacterized membrane protein YphA (DoxX/SURF4 family)